MTPTQARTAIKQRLDIDTTVTDFDSLIDGFVSDAVDRLFPSAMADAGAVTATVTVDSSTGQAVVDLSTLTTPLAGFRSIDVIGSDTYPHRVSDTYQYGNIVRLRGLSSTDVSIVVYGLNRYTLATIPAELKRAIYYYGMADFYNFLVGNKRKFNVYMQNGGSAMDDMDQIAAGLEAKADAIVQEKGVVYGR